MLFHTWPFLIFLVIVLPGFYALRKTRLWIPWLMVASYFFYGWWKPWYLILVVYSTTLDYLLVTLMDRCPREGGKVDLRGRLARLRFDDSTLKLAYIISSLLTVSALTVAAVGSETLRPTMLAFGVLVFLMALGALLGSRRIWLFISLFNNLALLLFFKYAGFVSGNINDALAWLPTVQPIWLALGTCGLLIAVGTISRRRRIFVVTTSIGLALVALALSPFGAHITTQILTWCSENIQVPKPDTLMPYGFAYVLPVGISFFTFQSMSYTIDFYLGKCARERNFLRFATFVCFFPQLMAGPIERAKHLLPQFQEAPPFEVKNLTDGLSLFVVGLFKKLALSNYLALYVDRVYENPSMYGAPALSLATFAFAWQIFFDFSGYTDMARGLAKMMGFNLILNFNNPYMATGLGEFWQRWHISLSSWFRDYVYIPLGGNRAGKLAMYRNLFITFLVSGIWHGANWTFAIWGILHAVGVMLTRELERSTFYRDRVPAIFKQAWVFIYVCFAWIFFRAASMQDATLIVKRIFTGVWTNPYVPGMALLLVALVWMYQFTFESKYRPLLRWPAIPVALVVCMVVYMCICASGGGAFIYFQF